MEYSINSILSMNMEYCYGCGGCEVVCPIRAIHMERNDEGFLYPVVNAETCTNCGLCKKVCIIGNSFAEGKSDTFACSAKNDEILKKSTSGGMGYLFGREVLKEGGVVYGAAFEEDNSVHHIRVENEKYLWRIQGTKYVQSEMKEVFNYINMDIKAGKEILFTGTPCQTAAIQRTFGYYEKLYCVEIVCMGCPSPGVWESYLLSKESEIGKIKSVVFRDKKMGWRSSNISYCLVDGSQRRYRSTMDEYLSGFGQCLYLRLSCHVCEYKGRHTKGDIKIGDFWGIENSEIQFDARGVSVVIIETDRGCKLFNRVKQDLNVCQLEYKFALSSNPCIEISKAPSKNRDDFFSEWKNNKENTKDIIYTNLIKTFQNEDRYISQYPVVDGLLRLMMSEDGLRGFFKKSGFDHIAVYGMSDLGKLFVDMLLREGIEVVCLIDKNHRRFASRYRGIPVIGPYQIDQYNYDCIIVSLIHLYNSVLETMMAQGISLDKIISLGSVV